MRTGATTYPAASLSIRNKRLPLSGWTIDAGSALSCPSLIFLSIPLFLCPLARKTTFHALLITGSVRVILSMRTLLVFHPAFGQSQFRGEKDIWLPDPDIRYPLADKGQDLVHREYHEVFRPFGLVLFGGEMAARHASDQFRIIVLTNLCKK